MRPLAFALGALFAVASCAFADVTPPGVVVTKQDTLLIDTDGSGTVTPGDRIKYVIAVTNQGPADAENVVITDQTPSPSSLVPGSINTSPIARDDAYDVTGNVGLDVPAVSGLLQNDSDADGDAIVVFNYQSTTLQGGRVEVAPDGAFTYSPPPAYVGIDAFDYIIHDPKVGSDSGTVSLSLSNTIWFIDNTAAVGGDGTLAAPFNTVGAFNTSAADGEGDAIFVGEGDGTPNGYLEGFTLLNGQRLLGQGIDLAADSEITFPPHTSTLPGNAGSPTIGNVSGDGIALASNNTVMGLNVAVQGGKGITGEAVGTLIIDRVSVAATGGEGVKIKAGVLDVVLGDLSSSSSPGDGVYLDSVSGQFVVTGATDVNDSTGDGINIANSGSASIGFGTASITGAGADGIDLATGNAGAQFLFDDLHVSNLQGTGLLAFNSGTILCGAEPVIESIGGPALNIENTAGSVGAPDSFNFAALSSVNSLSSGVRLVELDEAVNLNSVVISNSLNLTGQHGILLQDLTGSPVITGGKVAFFGGIVDSDGIRIVNSDNVTIQGTDGGCIDPGSTGTCFEVFGAGTGTGDSGDGTGYHGIRSIASDGLTLRYVHVHDIGEVNNTDSRLDCCVYIDSVNDATVNVFDSRFDNTYEADALFIGDGSRPFAGLVVLNFSGNLVEDVEAAVQLSFNSTAGATLHATYTNNSILGPRIGFNTQIDMGAANAGNSGTGANGRNLIEVSGNLLRGMDNNGIVLDQGDSGVTLLKANSNRLDATYVDTTLDPDSPLEFEIRQDPGEYATIDLFCLSNQVTNSGNGVIGDGDNWDADGIRIGSAGSAGSADGIMRALVADNVLSGIAGNGVRIQSDESYDVFATVRNVFARPEVGSGGILCDFQEAADSASLHVWLEDSDLTDFYAFTTPSVSQQLNVAYDGSGGVVPDPLDHTGMLTILNSHGNRVAGADVDATTLSFVGSSTAHAVITGAIQQPN